MRKAMKSVHKMTDDEIINALFGGPTEAEWDKVRALPLAERGAASQALWDKQSTCNLAAAIYAGLTGKPIDLSTIVEVSRS